MSPGLVAVLLGMFSARGASTTTLILSEWVRVGARCTIWCADVRKLELGDRQCGRYDCGCATWIKLASSKRFCTVSTHPCLLASVSCPRSQVSRVDLGRRKK